MIFLIDFFDFNILYDYLINDFGGKLSKLFACRSADNPIQLKFTNMIAKNSSVLIELIKNVILIECVNKVTVNELELEIQSLELTSGQEEALSKLEIYGADISLDSPSQACTS